MRLQNTTELTSHGNIEGRRHILEMLDAGATACDPYNNTRDLIQLNGTVLTIGGLDFEASGDPQTGVDTYDIRQFDHIYVVAAGKGVYRVVQAIEDALGDYLTGGEMICKHGDVFALKKVHATFGNHPTPDEGCVQGCRRIVELAKMVTEKDLVFTVIANGGSSLLTLPVEGVSLEDVIEVTRLCQIELGLITPLLNCIRNHIDQLKGGKLARIFSKAKLVNIAVEDINHQDMGPVQDFNYLMHHGNWLHNMPEGSTFQDALDVLSKNNVTNRCPKSILKVLEAACAENETVKYDEYQNFDYRVFGVMPQCRNFVRAIEAKAQELGYIPAVLAKHMNIHAADMGEFLAAMGNCIEQGDSFFEAPATLIVQGEMIVAKGNNNGIGGRNQECVLSACRQIRGSKRILCASIDTDGTDGPGGFCQEGAPACFSGGVVDGTSYDLACQKGIDIDAALREHNTTFALYNMGDAVSMSQGVSVGDILICIVTK